MKGCLSVRMLPKQCVIGYSSASEFYTDQLANMVGGIIGMKEGQCPVVRTSVVMEDETREYNHPEPSCLRGLQWHESL